MTTSSRTLGDLFEAFEREAFRLETLDDYSKSGSVDAYQAFLAEEPQPDDYNAGWIEELRSHTEKGKRVYRSISCPAHECVEVAFHHMAIAVRDSKAPQRAQLSVPHTAFAAFVEGLKR